LNLRCPAHQSLLVTNGDGFLCPEGHTVNAVNLTEVLVECIGVLAAPSGAGSYSGTVD